jgi:hypothetical protein
MGFNLSLQQELPVLWSLENTMARIIHTRDPEYSGSTKREWNKVGLFDRWRTAVKR